MSRKAGPFEEFGFAIHPEGGGSDRPRRRITGGCSHSSWQVLVEGTSRPACPLVSDGKRPCVQPGGAVPIAGRILLGAKTGGRQLLTTSICQKRSSNSIP